MNAKLWRLTFLKSKITPVSKIDSKKGLRALRRQISIKLTLRPRKRPKNSQSKKRRNLPNFRALRSTLPLRPTDMRRKKRPFRKRKSRLTCPKPSLRWSKSAFRTTSMTWFHSGSRQYRCQIMWSKRLLMWGQLIRLKRKMLNMTGYKVNKWHNSLLLCPSSLFPLIPPRPNPPDNYTPNPPRHPRHPLNPLHHLPPPPPDLPQCLSSSPYSRKSIPNDQRDQALHRKTYPRPSSLCGPALTLKGKDQQSRMIS